MLSRKQNKRWIRKENGIWMKDMWKRERKWEKYKRKNEKQLKENVIEEKCKDRRAVKGEEWKIKGVLRKNRKENKRIREQR